MPPLRRQELEPDPLSQFEGWWELAQREVPLAEAMTLATVAPDGTADARMVLLKGAQPPGFRFYTNERSAKGAQLEACPRAALVIYWRELDRQVRVRGAVQRVGETEADAYFASRPRDSQLGAWASPQSEPIAERDALERRLDELERRYEGADVPRPSQWGGYLVVPDEVEFWQGRRGRLHDRFRYRRAGEGGAWEIERLAP